MASHVEFLLLPSGLWNNHGLVVEEAPLEIRRDHSIDPIILERVQVPRLLSLFILWPHREWLHILLHLLWELSSMTLHHVLRMDCLLYKTLFTYLAIKSVVVGSWGRYLL